MKMKGIVNGKLVEREVEEIALEVKNEQKKLPSDSERIKALEEEVKRLKKLLEGENDQ